VRPARRERAGFTLAEVAVTLLIVGIGLVLVLEGLTRAKLLAAETHYRKVARELALLTLGQVEAGLFWEELRSGENNLLTGTYAEEGHEDFHYEVVLGEQDFLEPPQGDGEPVAYHDSWEYERERQERAREEANEDDEEEVVEAFEKVRIKITFPQLSERPNSLVLERWIPWAQVYGNEEGTSDAASQAGEPPPEDQG
jgi:prepilin-type N-terminal cleavage/methylation domain-containing protein